MAGKGAGKGKAGKAAKRAYGQKKERVNVALTPEVVQKIDDLAEANATSRSELIEKTFRQLPGVASVEDQSKKKVGVDKPTWMTMQQWRELLALYGGIPQSAYTKKTALEAKLVVDHKLPRARGGKTEVDNLQFLTEEENLKKWANEDKYWTQDFYYDKPHDPNGFRHAQYFLAYRKILDYTKHFQRPWSQINRVVHLLAWITGAGKTMSIHAICFALNQVLRKEKGIAYPRVDRILVLVKEQALRDQLEKELRDDVVSYGICKASPRVGVVKSNDKFELDYWLEQYDIVVACLQQVWKRDNGIPRDNIEQILGKFAVIFFDEPHFAEPQVAELAEQATRSLCFGLTSTPINAKGNVLKSYVLFSQCGLREAYEEQQNLKYLSSSIDVIEQLKIIEYVKIDTARDYHRGTRTLVQENPDTPDYNIQIEAARNVAGKVVSYVKYADRLCERIHFKEITPEAAPHRDQNYVDPTLIYPMHAMISVKTKHDAEVIERYLNQMFRSDSSQYPPEQGFRAEVVLSSGEDEEGNPVKGKKLETNHPWLKCWQAQKSKNAEKFQMTKQGWQLPEDSARFLVVVEMAREGINNPFCGVVGLGKRTQSIIEVIQRLIGRQIRSYTEKFISQLRVPPKPLDTIKIFTHEAWEFPRDGDEPDYATRQRILDGLHFCEYMDEWLSELITLEDLIENGTEVAPDTEATDKGVLTTEDKLAIAFDLGDYQLKGEEVPEQKIIDDWCGQNSKKRELGKEWIDLVKNSSDRAKIALNQNVSLRTLHIIERERPKNNPNLSDLRWFLEVHCPNSLPSLEILAKPGVDETLKTATWSMAEGWYKDYMAKFHSFSDFPKVTDFHEIRKTLVKKLYRQLRYSEYKPEISFIEGHPKDIKEAAWESIGYAVKTVLGLEKAEKGGEHDTPQYHAVLSDPSVVRNILGYARQRLLERFARPPLAQSLQIFHVDPNRDVD
jgi:superfamily II DNA or RNA helicase/5-methylcytosine-specific restriction endonuclease McrA